MKKFGKKKAEPALEPSGASPSSPATKKGGKGQSAAKIIKQAAQDKAIEHIKAGNIEALEKMCEESSEDFKFLNRLHTKSGKSSLGVAAEEGRIGSMEILLKAKATVDLVDKTGMTALLYAGKSGELEIIEMLNNAEADLHVKSQLKFENALMLACQGNHLKCVELLSMYGLAVDDKNKLEETALSIALKYEYYPICSFLVEREANINVRGVNGNTPLIRSAFDGREATAEFILTHGGDANLKNFNGETALMVACRHGYVKMVNLFLQYGADINAADESGRTALMLACMVGKGDIIRILIDKGADVNQVDSWGYSALMCTCNRRLNFTETQLQEHFDLIELLIGRGAYIDNMDKNYNTALMHCCEQGNMLVAKFLLELGADSSFRSINNVSMIDLIPTDEDRAVFAEALELAARRVAEDGNGTVDPYDKPGTRRQPGWIGELNDRKKHATVKN